MIPLFIVKSVHMSICSQVSRGPCLNHESSANCERVRKVLLQKSSVRITPILLVWFKIIVQRKIESLEGRDDLSAAYNSKISQKDKDYQIGHDDVVRASVCCLVTVKKPVDLNVATSLMKQLLYYRAYASLICATLDHLRY